MGHENTSPLATSDKKKFDEEHPNDTTKMSGTLNRTDYPLLVTSGG